MRVVNFYEEFSIDPLASSKTIQDVLDKVLESNPSEVTKVKVAVARQILTDVNKRSQYDHSLRVNKPLSVSELRALAETHPGSKQYGTAPTKYPTSFDPTSAGAQQSYLDSNGHNFTDTQSLWLASSGHGISYAVASIVGVVIAVTILFISHLLLPYFTGDSDARHAQSMVQEFLDKSKSKDARQWIKEYGYNNSMDDVAEQFGGEFRDPADFFDTRHPQAGEAFRFGVLTTFFANDGRDLAEAVSKYAISHNGSKIQNRELFELRPAAIIRECDKTYVVPVLTEDKTLAKGAIGLCNGNNGWRLLWMIEKDGVEHFSDEWAHELDKAFNG